MATDKYKKLTPIEHVLHRPEMYVGSVENQPVSMFLLNQATKRMEWSTVQLNHGLLKLMDEILLNAADNILVSGKRGAPEQTYIRVTLNPTNGAFTVENDGAGIPVKLSKDHKILIPEMIFGHLLTSSNYDNDADSVAAGRHGYGAKLSNVMSVSFTAKCRCAGKEVELCWSDHMRHLAPYRVESVSEKSPPRTRISFVPDLSIFGVTQLSNDMFRVVQKRVMDLAATFTGVKVTFNGELVSFPSFEAYASLYSEFAPTDDSSGDPRLKPFVVETKTYKLAVVPQQQSSISRRSFSVVNGIVTFSGGTHVHAAQDMLAAAASRLAAQLKKSGTVINASSLLRHFALVLIVSIGQPKFDSQSKVRLVSKFSLPQTSQVTAQLTEYFANSPLVQNVSQTASDLLSKEIKQLMPVVKRTSLIASIPKLVDADQSSGSGQRTLIVTEGDSAKALALNSLSHDQRRTYGIFPLRGKLLNVRRNNAGRLKKCKELLELFASLGIEIGKTYTSPESLRYQRLMIMTDQDADGTHIKGLLISAFESLWPSLLHRNPNFITVFSTPLIRATVSNGTEPRSFYSRAEFEEWKRAHPADAAAAHVKYYKGLGTSTTAEGKAYFRAMDQHTVSIVVEPKDRELLDNVFDAEEVDWRKDWLTSRAATDDVDVDRSKKTMSIATFVSQEMIHYAIAGNLRALPSAVDGLKPSQRKILWACLSKPLVNSSKIAQVSGFIAEVSAFHHGEASLQQTMIKMAQDFTGSNNVNLLEPEGQFGSRQHLGTDHAAPRYIFTKLSPFTRLLFPKADDQLLQYVEDEGKSVEPQYYVPIIPLLLVNGSVGIGFGFMSHIQPHHPLDVVHVVRRMLRGDSAADATSELKPWAVGFIGSIVKRDEGLASRGAATARPAPRGAGTIIRVQELPWDTSIDSFRLRVASLAESGVVQKIVDYSGANHVDADVYVSEGKNLNPSKLFDELGLLSGVSTNATVYDPKFVLTPLGSNISKIAEWHFEQRRALYVERKKLLLGQLSRDLKEQKSLHKFVSLVRAKEVNFANLSHSGLVEFCSQRKLARDASDSFDYILRKPVTFFTTTSTEKLEADIASLEKQMSALSSKSPESLWEEDLVRFEQAILLREEKLLEQQRQDRRPPQVGEEPIVDHRSPQDQYERVWKSRNSSSPRGGGGAGGGMVVVAREIPVAATADQGASSRWLSVAVAACVTRMRRMIPQLLLT